MTVAREPEGAARDPMINRADEADGKQNGKSDADVEVGLGV